MTHPGEEQLVAHAFGDLDPDAAARVLAHLKSCAGCRAQDDEIRATLAAVPADEVPERGPDYGAEVWARLEPRLASAARHGESGWRVPRAWLAVAAALLLALTSFVAGRWSRGPAAPAPATVAAEDVRERVLLAAMADHLDRTERTLLELVNTSNGEALDISAEQAWAEDLLAANRLYRQTAGRAGEPALSPLLDELERVLLAIVHSPSRLTAPELAELRERIDERGLVFKVRMTGAQVRARQERLAAPRGDKTS